MKFYHFVKFTWTLIQLNLHVITSLTGTCRAKPACSIRWIIITLLQPPASLAPFMSLLSSVVDVWVGASFLLDSFVLVGMNPKIHCILGVRHWLRPIFHKITHTWSELKFTRSCGPTSLNVPIKVTEKYNTYHFR